MTPGPAASKAVLADIATPRDLFLAGALIFPAFLFQQDVGVRCVQTALFFLLCWLAGRRVRVVRSLITAAGIVAINLAVPVGRVLFSLPFLPVTDGAVFAGVAKATAVAGMIALSRFSIRPGLKLPGRLGGLVGRSLYYFERVMSERKKVRRESVLRDIDDLLISIHQGPHPEGKSSVSAVTSTTAAGAALLTLTVVVNWSVLLYTYLRPGLLWAR